MPSNLELIGINERSGLITPNLYKQDWTVPSNLVNNYSVLHTRALSDTVTPIYGKGTGIFLDTTNGGGEYDINGNQVSFVGSGRGPLMALNYSTWTFNSNVINWYSMTHPHALAGSDVHGKGTNDGIGFDGTYVAHTNYAGGSSDDVTTRNSVVFGMYKNLFIPTLPNTYYTITHPNANAPSTLPPVGSILGSGDAHGKGTLDSTILNVANNFILPAHTNYAGGSSDDIISRNNNIFDPQNTYWVDISSPGSSTNWYTITHPNALAGTDVHGKGTNDGMGFDGTYAAHMNYKGGSSDDINGNPAILNSGRINANTMNFTATLSSGNKPFGYGYNTAEGYDSSYPICSNPANTINVGAIHW